MFKRYRYLLIVGLLLFSTSLFADFHLTNKIDWPKLIMGLFGGLALFLYGMDMMSKGMKKSAGKKMRSVLSALTYNRYVGMAVGTFVTMVIQSSSATTVMLVSFVQAGLMSFGQTLGVILGASIGTTVTAQLVAFKVTHYSLLMIAIGFGVKILAKKDYVKYIGEALLGFGILFFGMKVMSDSMYPLRSYAAFIDLLRGLENPVYGILFGMLFTALIQSSSAFLGIVIILAQQDLITLEAGVPLVIGTNIGTCITAVLASIGASMAAKRVAVAHTLFKILGALIVVAWIPTFAEMVRELCLKFEFGNARQIANAHTIYNVGLAILFLPFTRYFASLIRHFFPDDPKEKEIKPIIRHLDEALLSTPDMAVEMVRAEMDRMSKALRYMLKASIIPFVKEELPNDEQYPHLGLVEGIHVCSDKIKYIERKVNDYLIKLCMQELDDEMADEVFGLMSITKDMGAVGKIINDGIVFQIGKKQMLKMGFSPEGLEEIKLFHEKVCKQIGRVNDAFEKADFRTAEKVVYKMGAYCAIETESRASHMARVSNSRKHSIETHEVHMALMDLLKQINVYTGEIAKTIAQLCGPAETDEDVVPAHT